MSVALVSIDEGTHRSLVDVIQPAVGAVAVDREGRLAAAGMWSPPNDPLRIWDLESGEQRTLSAPESAEESHYTVIDLQFLPDGNLISSGEGGVRRWDLGRETSETLHASASARIDVSGDGRFLLVAAAKEINDTVLERTRLLLFDLESGTQREITTHGSSLQLVAFDPTGRIIVTGDAEGVVRVGLVTGEEPHLLLGHDEHVKALVVSPDSRWIFSAVGAEIRRWPMPDLSEPPVHILPIESFLGHLRSMTNLRVIEDSESQDGWKLEVGPFSG
jgi:WD40 repeat protein